jgi:hypothetical protein
LGYKNLLEVERAFRDLKTTLELRPIYHRLELRIRAGAAVLAGAAAVRVAERQTGRTWRLLATELGRVHQVTLAGPAGRVQHTTRLTPLQRETYAELGVAPPPAVTAWTRLSDPAAGWRCGHTAAQIPWRYRCSSAPRFTKPCARQLRNSGHTIQTTHTMPRLCSSGGSAHDTDQPVRVVT